jgi:hypothetical protein
MKNSLPILKKIFISITTSVGSKSELKSKSAKKCSIRIRKKLIRTRRKLCKGITLRVPVPNGMVAVMDLIVLEDSEHDLLELCLDHE